MNNVQITKIYLDLDGVVADFNRRYIELFHTDPKLAEKNHNFDHYFEEFIEGQNFATLPMMPHAMELINFLKRLPIPTVILSSTANEEKWEVISKQKREWLDKHGIHFPAIFVPGKKHKKEYATETALIIDDTESIIDDWRAEGGPAIWYKDHHTTMLLLSWYLRFGTVDNA